MERSGIWNHSSITQTLSLSAAWWNYWWWHRTYRCPIFQRRIPLGTDWTPLSNPYSTSYDNRNGSDVCAVFEGLMDYLSVMQLGIIHSDWLVLNSISNVEKAMKALQNYEKIEYFLDNDEAGRRTFQRLHDCFGEKVIDRSALYADHKDLNEFLLPKM